MSFAAKLGGVFADALISYIDKKFDAYLRKKFNFDEMVKEKDAKALELKDMIVKAQTEEERDVLLDKMDELLRSTIKFK